ncbi:HEAT repeat domain-containing protein [Sphingobacterium bovistauri]|uniref:HEAT repeat domain-containing protein n=1 Tax=Sphingobacterium bovistauri TaxID=2781959 RepID=A0ABS7Z6J6_9SPHI|nr:hypothetical protein [Sphingobacterium bovistauri]MCA5005794.1 hypothetical protein [Sphingobacterium bovistauri]
MNLLFGSINELTLVFLTLLIIVFILILLVMGYGYRNYQLLSSRRKWTTLIETKILLAILNGSHHIQDDVELKDLLPNKNFRDTFLSVLIESEKKFSGDAYRVLIEIFHTLNLKDFAWAYLNHKDSFKKVQGIEALTTMRVEDALGDIQLLLNNPNPFVVAEAQYAMVRFKDFKGLEFLNLLHTPISEWQQLRLLNSISEVPATSYSFISSLLSHSNISVISFVLSLIRKFRIVAFHDEVATLLEHPNSIVRILAVRTLHDIETERTFPLFTQIYGQQILNVKKAILHAIRKSKNKNSIDFLKIELIEGKPSLQIIAAETLIEFKEKKYLQDLMNEEVSNEHIHSIIKHALAVRI